MIAKHRSRMLKLLTVLLFMLFTIYWKVSFGWNAGTTIVPLQWFCATLYGVGGIGLMWGCLLALDRHCRVMKTGKYRV